MCGIIAVINPTIPSTVVMDNFKKGEHRGPDHSDFKLINNYKSNLLTVNQSLPIS
jgi:asparagine synthetase B (glutamine-hydrolysing)